MAALTPYFAPESGPVAVAVAVSDENVILSTDDKPGLPARTQPYVGLAVPIFTFLATFSGPLATAVAVSVAKIMRSTVVIDPGLRPPETQPSVVVATPAVVAYLLLLRGPFAAPAAVSDAKMMRSTILPPGASLHAYHPLAEKSCIPALSAAVVGKGPLTTPVAVSDVNINLSTVDTRAGPGPAVPPPIHMSVAKF